MLSVLRSADHLSESAARSFEEAADTCKRKVEAIVKECRRLNVKYNDPKFRLPDFDTLVNLSYGPFPDSWDREKGFVGSVKRVEVRTFRKDCTRPSVRLTNVAGYLRQTSIHH